jgi:hypothetical protein
MHVDDRALRAYLDNEDTAAERATVAAHLAGCADCRAALEALSARAAEVSAHLAVLAPDPREVPAAPHVLARVQTRVQSVEGEEKPSMFATVFSKRMRPVWIGLLVLAVLVAAVTIDPVRAWAGQFLGLFRVQQVAVVSLDTSRLSELGGSSSQFAQQMSQLMSEGMTITREPGEPQVVADAGAASKAAGFIVRLPAGRSDLKQLTVQGGAAFEFVVDRERAQAILDSVGRTDLQLPESVDGAKIKVDIPATVSATYGNCPQVSGSGTDMDKLMNRGGASPAVRYAGCVVFAQIPSPTIDTPPYVDVQRLAEIAFEFTGMTPAQARDFAATIDWTSTLVVPIPRDGATYQPVTVDGVEGYLIEGATGGPDGYVSEPADGASPQYVLIWVKDGIVYAIGGLSADTSAALEMANSLK